MKYYWVSVAFLLACSGNTKPIKQPRLSEKEAEKIEQRVAIPN